MGTVEPVFYDPVDVASPKAQSLTICDLVVFLTGRELVGTMDAMEIYGGVVALFESQH